MDVKKEQWPRRPYADEIKNRAVMLQIMAADPNAVEKLKAFYRKNPIAFIEDWCMTYNPRNAEYKNMPFILFQRQKDFLLFLQECIRDKESGLIEKARDIGATWLCCAYSVWLLLFVPGASVGWGSRKEQLVDTLGDMDSLFEKMRFLIRNIPGELWPEGFDMRKHATYMKIINPANGAAITGEAGDNIGRGGRKSIYFKDESAHYERPELIEAALGDNTDVQIDISSVNGTANVFYRRRQSGTEWKPGGKKIGKGITRVFTFDWRDHPLKTQEWYDARRAKANREGLLHIFAQEVDRDYTSSIQGVIIPAKWVAAAVDAHIKLGIKPEGEKVGGQDVADEGGDKHAFVWRHGIVCMGADHWAEGDGGDAARVTLPICSENGIRELYYDSIGVGASFKTETNRIKELGQLPGCVKIIQPWNAGMSGEGLIDPDENIIRGDRDTPINRDYFLNLKIQGWWRLRWRFEKTYKVITQGAYYPPDELISLPSWLPNLEQLKRELSQAVIKTSENGKMKVDKKPEGTHSPNLADGCVICYNPYRNVSILDVLGFDNGI